MAITWKKLAFEDDVILKALLTTRGDMMFRNATIPARLAKGNLNDVLTQGANDPFWQAPGGGATLTVAETEVYNAAAPTTWTDLNLSGTIGSQASLVLLKFSGSFASRIAFRRNGDTDEAYNIGNVPMGTAVGEAGGSGQHIRIWVETDASGIVEWKRQDTVTTVIDVTAYIK